VKLKKDRRSLLMQGLVLVFFTLFLSTIFSYTGLFGVHFNIEDGTGRANTEHPGTVPSKTSYSISMDEADELAKWLIERLQDIRERSGIGRNSG